LTPLPLVVALEKATSFQEQLTGWAGSASLFLVGLWRIQWGNQGLWWSGGRMGRSNNPWFDQSLDESIKSG
jgi:hypothetical protein